MESIILLNNSILTLLGEEGKILEYQRYGRNKATLVNKGYIESGEYRSKFDNITDDNLIAMHTHPHSMPPSIADFNSAFLHRYDTSLVICHDGKIFSYQSKEVVSEQLYNMYIEKNIVDGFDEYQAQVEALNMIKKNYKIDFWEVKPKWRKEKNILQTIE